MNEPSLMQLDELLHRAMGSSAWVAIYLILAIAANDVRWACIAFGVCAGFEMCVALMRIERFLSARQQRRMGQFSGETKP